MNEKQMSFDTKQVQKDIDSITKSLMKAEQSMANTFDQEVLDIAHMLEGILNDIRKLMIGIRDNVKECIDYMKNLEVLVGEISFNLGNASNNADNFMSKFFTGIGNVNTVLDFVNHIDQLSKSTSNATDKIIDVGKESVVAGKAVSKLGTKVGTATQGMGSLAGAASSIAALAGALAVWVAVAMDAWNTSKHFRDSVKELGAAFSKYFSTLKSNYEKFPIDKILKIPADLANSFLRLELNIFIDSLTNWLLVFEKIISLDFNGLVDQFTHLDKWIDKVGANIAEFFDNIFQVNERALEQQKKFGESLFDGKGIDITEYTDSLQKYFDTIITNYPSVEKYNQIIESSKIAYRDAYEEMGILLTQMNTDQYKVTAEDIDRISLCLQNMKIASNDASQAQLDGITKLVLKYQEQGLASTELANQVISDAKKIQLAEQGYTEEFINKIMELNKAFDEGKIAENEYSKSLLELYNQYDKTASIAEQKLEIFRTLGSDVKITAKDFNSLAESVKGMAYHYKEGISQVEVSSNKNLQLWSEYLLRLRENYTEESEEYRHATEMMKTETESRAQILAEMKNSYVLYLFNILEELVNAQQVDEVEAKNLCLAINGELGKIGYDMDIKVGDSLESIKKVVSEKGQDIKKDVALMLIGTRDDITEVTPSIVEGFCQLAQLSEEEFAKRLSKLPIDVQRQVIDKMREQGVRISKELQEGINQECTFVRVDANVQPANEKIDKLLKPWSVFSPLGNFSLQAGYGKKDGGVFSNGIWHNIPQFANGGLPSHGSMFIAGEHGAEIVGHINGTTEVLNRSQIASSIYSAVLSAMNHSSQSSQIDVHVHTDEGTVIDRIEQRTHQTGTFPFTIPTY